jgi:DNA polymerase
MRLHIDIETRSSVDLFKCGVYKYAESQDFRVLCIAWDTGEEHGIEDLTRGYMPKWLVDAILNPEVTKVAFNATFERVCLSKHLELDGFISPVGWECTMLKCAHDGIIGSLKVCAEFGGSVNKLSTGKDLIKLFCIPIKITEAREKKLREEESHILNIIDLGGNDGADIQEWTPRLRQIEAELNGGFYTGYDFPKEWQEFLHYCEVDVQAEKSIVANNGFDAELYIQSELINDRGVHINRTLCENAVITCNEFKFNAMDSLKKLTGLDNPNSHVQFKAWLTSQGYPLSSTDKKHCLNLMDEISEDSLVYKALEVKLSMSATSVSKYQKMLDMQCLDGRVRGIHRMNGGATRRFSGQGIQGQNLARGEIDSTKRDELLEGGNLTPDECKILIRSAIEGDFIVADFSSIEKLVMSWLVDDLESLDAFDKGLDLYILSASKIYNKPYESVTKDERSVAKVAELAFGYQGARGAALAFGADKFLSLDQIDELVVTWRSNNQKIVKTWYAFQDAFLKVISTRKPVQVGKIMVYYRNEGLYLKLPNNLELSYPRPKLVNGKFGVVPSYARVRNRALLSEETYGGKIFENVVQSIAFMLLRETLLRLSKWKVVMHVHDEVVVEKTYPWQSLEMLIATITRPIPWCPGLKLKADGFTDKFYRKG